ncbi:MAG: 30S ribosomal protein S2 [Nanoarchaeota archaeon]|nr:30S ribosomal protein S2 [Nanoarchaeota archaeon]
MPRKKAETEESVQENIEENKTNSKKKIVEAKTEISDKKAKMAAILEKAKQLEKAVSEAETETKDIKQKMSLDEEKIDTLVPIEDYLKSSIHLGTRVITPDMKQFVYKRRADGLAVFNTALLDKRIREAADFLSNYAPEDIILVCKREAGWKAVELFSKIMGIESFTKKYPAGILTNPILDTFRETELVLICDPWIDRNALDDARRIKVPILGICDTNNYTQGVTQILPGNNKSAKSLGMIFYLLAKIYAEKRKIKITLPPISEFVENWENLTPPK